MSLSIAGQEISILKIVEDDPGTRDSLAEIVEDVDITPDKMEGPFNCSLEVFLESQVKGTDAFIFDHNLKQTGYADFNGAEAVASLYKKCPSVLCTAWTNAAPDTIRLHRRYIPSLVHSDVIDTDILARGLEICINEFKGKYLPSREPIKTLVRIENVDEDQKPIIINAVVPSWNPKEVIRFPLTLVPADMRESIREGVRLLAEVNLGAENHTELFLDAFEFRG